MIKSAEEGNSPDSGMPEFCLLCGLCVCVCVWVLKELAIKKIKNMGLEHLIYGRRLPEGRGSKKHQQGKDPPGRTLHFFWCFRSFLSHRLGNVSP